MENKLKNNEIIVLDTDVGTDDAMAFLLINSLKLKIDYIVTTFGNTTFDKALKNAILLKKRLGLTSQIVSGLNVAKSEIIPLNDSDTFHGTDGLGGYSDTLESNLNITNEELLNYITFDEFKQKLLNEKRITYITIGPLTNISNIICDNLLKPKITQILVMGGGLKEFNCPNNTEFNFSKNPNSVKSLLSSNLNITLFPLDITNKQIITNEDIKSLEKYNTHPEFIYFLKYNLKSNIKFNNINGAVLHDTLPILYLANPNNFNIEKTKIMSDNYGSIKENINGTSINICYDIKEGYFKEEIFNAFKK